MTFENRFARTEARRPQSSDAPPKQESSLGTLLLWALFLSLVWAALAYPLGAMLAFLVLGPLGGIFLLPYLLLRRNRRTSPERSAILDLLSHLNPFH